MLLEVFHKSGNSRSLLSDGYIYTIHWFSSLIEALLIDDGINGDSSLTCLPVTNDKLTLSSSDRNHRIDRLDTRLQRFLHGLAIDHSRSLSVEWHLKGVGEVDVSLTVDSLSKRIDDTSKHVVVDAYRSDSLRALHHHALLDTLGRTEQHATYVVLLKVHHDCHSAVLEFEKLVGFSVSQSVDTSHTVAHLEHSTDLVKLLSSADALQLLKQHL